VSDAVELAHRLLDLARAGSPELIGYLTAGAPVNLTDPAGNTLLMLAAYHGHAELTAALLAQGADPNRINDRGQTPLAGAIFKAETEIVQALVAGGADPALGTPSAYDTARFFQRDDLLALLPHEA
jgi:ankyrin repeat protein